MMELKNIVKFWVVCYVAIRMVPHVIFDLAEGFYGYL